MNITSGCYGPKTLGTFCAFAGAQQKSRQPFWAAEPCVKWGECMAVSEEQLANERKLYKRLLLTHDDLNHAKSFAEALLNEADHSTAIRQALKTAMIVSYCRPFTDNEGSVDALRTLPTKKFLSEFDEKNRATHEWIRAQRNTVMAHSDSSVYGITVNVANINDVKFAMPIKWNPWSELPKNEIEAILCNIGKIKEKVTEETIRIQELLPTEDRF